MTYDKCEYDIPPYQEGNEQDFEFELYDNIQVDQISDITFQVKTPSGTTIIAGKKLSLEEITLIDRVVRIPLMPVDTIGKAGVHLYEIDFINSNGNPFATIGGTFTVDKQVNSL